MGEFIDATRELRELAALASNPNAIDEVLDRSLAALKPLIPYDLAAVLAMDGDRLAVRAATGPLASARVRSHSVSLSKFPTVKRAMETRRPVALLEHDHASEEGDPYDGVLELPDGHSCMVVPLFAGERTLGAMTFDQKLCRPYPQETVELAGIYGQIIALALAFAEQATLLDRYRRRVQEQHQLEQEDAGEAGTMLEQSHSPKMQQLIASARQVAVTSTCVLIQGETGAGKEVLAQAIHEWSDRRKSPFIKLNCASIPENLVESELFGHSKGAFTGASEKRSGRFLVANGGTLFLDELGELSPATQARLLRVLQDGTFQPVGSDQTIRVDVRVIAATHVDLTEAVRAGKFRADLYYRLAVFPLCLPPLRERREDLPMLTGTILTGLTRKTGRGPWKLSDEVLGLLASQSWPGNVRQLANVLERATILKPYGELEATLFSGLSDGRDNQARSPSSLPSFEDLERSYLQDVMAHTRGRIYGTGGAAEIVGVPPSTLQSRMKKLGISRT